MAGILRYNEVVKKECPLKLIYLLGAQAGLYYNYGIRKYPLERKLSGIFRHRVLDPSSELVRGFDEEFWAPHSRYSTVKREDILACDKVELISDSETAGVFLVVSKSRRNIFITGHVEYDYNTLDSEYKRDIDKGLDIAIPENYYPDDDPSKTPVNRWRSHAHLLFSNWLNYFVYQQTPYDISKIKSQR